MFLEGCYYTKNEFRSNRETLIFLHGLTGHGRVWKNYINYFKKNYNILVIDLIGNGKSIRPFSPKKYSIEYLTQVILKILDKENIKSAHLIAHSYSFLIALEILKTRKNLIKSAVFISPYLPQKEKFIYKIERVSAAILAFFLYLMPTRKKYRKKDYDKKFPRNYEKDNSTREFDVMRIIDDTLTTGIKSYVFLNYYSLKYHPVIKNINFPVLIITGEKDNIILLEDVKRIYNQIKTAELIILKEKNHILLYPHRKKLTLLISNYLKNKKHIRDIKEEK